MNPSALRTIVAEWLEEDQIPTLVPRHRPVVDVEGLKNILAIVRPSCAPVLEKVPSLHPAADTL